MAGTATISWINNIGLVDIIFPDVTNWQESPAHVWGPITGNNGEGRANKYIAVGTSGFIQATYTGATNANTAIILDPSNSIGPDYYSVCDYGLYVDASGVDEYFVAEDGVYTGTGHLTDVGDLFRINVVNTVVTAEYYRGGTWTVAYTYPTRSADLYLMGSSANPGSVVNLNTPMSFNAI